LETGTEARRQAGTRKLVDGQRSSTDRRPHRDEGIRLRRGQVDDDDDYYY